MLKMRNHGTHCFALACVLPAFIFSVIAVAILVFVYNASLPKDEGLPRVPDVKKSAAADFRDHPFSKVEGLAR